MLRHRSPIPAGLDFSAVRRATSHVADDEEYLEVESAAKARSLGPLTPGTALSARPCRTLLPHTAFVAPVSFLTSKTRGVPHLARRRSAARLGAGTSGSKAAANRPNGLWTARTPRRKSGCRGGSERGEPL
jgi:hypothetical protein